MQLITQASIKVTAITIPQISPNFRRAGERNRETGCGNNHSLTLVKNKPTPAPNVIAEKNPWKTIHLRDEVPVRASCHESKTNAEPNKIHRNEIPNTFHKGSSQMFCEQSDDVSAFSGRSKVSRRKRGQNCLGQKRATS